MSANSDPLRPHAHDPNPDPPSGDPIFTFRPLTAPPARINVASLSLLPQSTLHDCFIVSTGHGTSGPFTFSGITVRDFLDARLPASESWQQVEILSGDEFGTRVDCAELSPAPASARPLLLATHIDGVPLTRAQGLVRLIVPGERDDALRQVKWVAQIIMR